jgi:two-component system, OmpR family, sensor histidine kinase RstB
VRTALWLLLATLLTTLLARAFLEAPAERAALDLVGGHAARIAQQLAEAPADQRRERAQAIERALGYGMGLEPAQSGPSPRAEWRSSGLFVIARAPGTPGQVRMGPLPAGRVATLPEVVLLALGVSLGVAWLGARPIWRRIQALDQVASRMCKGDFAARAPAVEGDVLDVVARSLNRLADRIGQLLSDERDLLRTVAHEVRAPIARMRFRVEHIQGGAGDAEGSESAGLVGDLQQVDGLFEELLTYVAFDEFDYERPVLQTTTIPLASSVRAVVDEVTATAADLSVSVDGSESATIVANRRLFERAVTNLVLNAMAYGEGKIAVFVREHEQHCVVDVQDNGPGIPERDRLQVVKPFVRLAKKKTRGTGLGLAIVTRIMALHEGRLHIVDAPGGGASMQLVWKNARPRPLSRWRLLLGPVAKRAGRATGVAPR